MSAILRVSGACVVKKKNTKSSVWKEFGIRATEDGKVIASEQNSPLCLTCGKSVQAKGSNTTNLWQHLREHHPSAYAEISSEKASKKDGECSMQLTLDKSNSKANMYPSTSNQAKELNKAVAYFIAKDTFPIATVNKPGFKHLVSKLNPRYEIPSRKHFTDFEIPALYSLIKDSKVKPVLAQAECYSATTDLWTSGSCDPYITFTIHTISEDWSLASFCLETVPLYEDHTGQNIADAVLDILGNWSLNKEKLVAVTTDNGSNVVVAFRNIAVLRVSCFGHNLDLAIKKILRLPQVRQALARCHSLVELFHRSWKKARDLRQKQEELGLPQHKLMGDVPTRWGSTYNMISRILEQQQAISAIMAGERKYWNKMPTDIEFTTLETLSDVLKPLSVLTDALAGEKQVTASALIPILKHVTDCLTPASGESRLMKELKDTIRLDLQSRYDNKSCVFETLSVASFLDPRFKHRHLQLKEEIITRITSECIGSFVSSETIQEESPPPAKKLKGLAAVLSHIDTQSTPGTSTVLSPSEKINLEISSYMDIPTLEMDADPLVRWKLECLHFPNLAVLARKYLSICGTSVPSERMFSLSGHICSNSRNRLLPENVNKLVFLARNM